MRKGTKSIRLFVALLVTAALGAPASAQFGLPLPPPPLPLPPPLQAPAWLPKLEPILQQRVSLLTGRSLVIVRAVNASSLGAVQTLIRGTGGTLSRTLAIIDGQAANVPNVSLSTLAASSLVLHISLDRLYYGAME